MGRSITADSLSLDVEKVSEGGLYLQKILNDLGYLTFKETGLLQGSFMWHTGLAVDVFPNYNEIFGKYMKVCNKRTERELANVMKGRN